MSEGQDEGGELPAGGGGGGGESAGGVTPGSESPVVTETTRWRERAMELEGQLGEARAALAQAQSALDEARRALARSEQRRQVEQSLAEASPIDPEAALILVEHALSGMPEPDVKAAVGQLRRSRPWLFRPASSAAAASAAIGVSGADAVDNAAREAAASGDRRALLRYLRARRPG